MDKEELKVLIEKYKSGEATDGERAVFEGWYLKLHEGEGSGYAAHELLADADMVWVQLERDFVEVGAVGLQRGTSRRLWPRVVVAAAVSAIVFGIWFYTSQSSSVGQGAALATVAGNDIAPGSNRAVLTLANGDVIALSDSKAGVVVGDSLIYSDGSAVRYASGSRSAGSQKGSQRSAGPVGVRALAPTELQGADGKGQMLVASTPRGGTYQVVLSDGTKVWLNADSKIEFPSSFMNVKARIVKLSGEAYFEVFKDKAHPFIVETAGLKGGEGQSIEVLGTHFNVSSYADSGPVKTSLIEGSVRVRNGLASLVLKPGEQALGSPKGPLKVPGDAADAVAWKDGKFVFEYEKIESVMRKLARWYDAEIVYKGDFGDKTFTGSISRKDNISKILEKITYTQNVHFKIEGRRITVMP